MVTQRQSKMSTAQRRARRFSENFKIEKVREIEKGQTKIADICRVYEVTSTNVHRWIRKFGTMKDTPERIIVEIDSDTKQLIALKKRVAELERIVGQKQILIDFKDKMIDIAEEMYGVDIKKKFSTQQPVSLGKGEKKNPTV
jgi:transposase